MTFRPLLKDYLHRANTSFPDRGVNPFDGNLKFSFNVSVEKTTGRGTFGCITAKFQLTVPTNTRWPKKLTTTESSIKRIKTFE